jgi:hypothetical protein
MKNLSLAAIALLSTASTIVPAADPSGTTRQELAIGHALNGFPRISSTLPQQPMSADPRLARSRQLMNGSTI